MRLNNLSFSLFLKSHAETTVLNVVRKKQSVKCVYQVVSDLTPELTIMPASPVAPQI